MKILLILWYIKMTICNSSLGNCHLRCNSHSMTVKCCTSVWGTACYFTRQKLMLYAQLAIWTAILWTMHMAGLPCNLSAVARESSMWCLLPMKQTPRAGLSGNSAGSQWQNCTTCSIPTISAVKELCWKLSAAQYLHILVTFHMDI